MTKQIKKWLPIIFCFLLIMLFINFVSLIVYHSKNYTPSVEKIFYDTRNSIVELKANTGGAIESFGTAVFINDDGMLVTNAHLVTYKQSGIYIEFETLSIRFSYETDYRAVSLLKYDLTQDLAILKYDWSEKSNFEAITINNTLSLKSGNTVYAVGNGMNHGIGITKGIVSVPRVNIEYESNIRSVVQCDLVISEGNSGGALLDVYGRLIGITTFRLKDIGGNIIYGIAFCIPIEIVLDFF